MKTILLKECREHFKLALIAMAVFAVVLSGAYQNPDEAMQALLASGLLNATAIICALFGALLGWMQSHSESHRDLWAFLVHRPISRTGILLGKLAAGLLLYIVGAGLPLLAFIAMVQIPGAVAAPFEWAMTLPVTANLLGGMVCYLAGMLTGLRQARWYATRALALPAAVAVMVFIQWAAEFHHALAIVAAAAAVLGLGVWGAFQGNGHDRALAPAATAALALTFGAGATLILIAVSGLAAMLLGLTGPRIREYHSESAWIARDGTVYISVQRHDGSEVVHLDRTPAFDPATGRRLELRDDTTKRTVIDVKGGVPADARLGYSKRYLDLWRADAEMKWFWTPKGKLVGYDSITRRQTGTLTAPSGEAFLRPKAGQWDGVTLAPAQILATRTALYRAEPGRSAPALLSAVPAGETILTYRESQGEHVTVVTREQIRLFDLDGALLWEAPYEPGLPDYPWITIYTLEPPGNYAVKLDSARQSSTDGPASHAFWISESEGVHRRAELPLLLRLFPREGSAKQRLMVVLIPPPLALLATWRSGDRTETLSISAGTALLCVMTGFWIGRRHRHSLAAQLAWALFHLLFGVPGLLASTGLRDWPVREVCQSCRKKRSVEMETCEYCGARFDPPERNGTEVFEPLTKPEGARRQFANIGAEPESS